jgi:general secretion pathway protein E
MPNPNDPITPETVEFSLTAVTDGLKKSRLIDEGQAQEVIRNARVKAATLRRRLKSKESDQPYVSPIEILASFDFPSKNPRRRTMDEAEICQGFSGASSVPFTRIDPLKLDARSVCTIISKPFARRNLLVPIKLEGGTLTVAMVNPFDKETIQSLEDVTGYTIAPVLGMRGEILKTINEIFAFEHSLIEAEKLKSGVPDLGNLEQLVDMVSDREIEASDQHVVNAVDLLFQYAYQQRASDIHIEPKRDRAVVRLRIDGRLHITHRIPKKVYPSIVSRIKIIARMDIAEKRKAQDGRIKTKFEDAEIELRVSSVPMAFGEKLVIRIFDPNILMQDLGSLGFFAEQMEAFERCLKHPHGIILVTGPTGSGKTTTLYSALRYLSNPEVNITTIEDPIEMVYDFFNQIAVQNQVGLTFATALRNVLRQDPDIIMVGEVRDRETAEYAVQAALTGHLVLTTLHTNTAVGAITRLRDLKVESFLLASTLTGILAQRLVRKVCPACDAPAEITAGEKQLFGFDRADADLSRLRKGKGCEKCRRTGYSGRTAVMEIVEINEGLRALIRDGAPEDEIEREARRFGSMRLMESASRKLLGGDTTTEEVLRSVPFRD